MSRRVRAGAGAGVLLVGLGVAVGGAAQGLPPVQPVDTVGLEEAVARALDASPQVVQAETGLGTAEFATRQAYAGFLPSLSVSSGASLASSERYSADLGTTISGQSESYSAGLSGSMDLFAGGRNLAQVRSARAGVAAAEATLVARRFAVALTAKRAYFAVLRGRDLIALAEERRRQADEQLAAAERRLRVGSATRSDVLRAQLEVRSARQAALQAETQWRTALYALGQVVGVPGPVEAEGVALPELAPLALSPEAMRRIVLEETPAVVSARADVAVADAGRAQARAQWLPTIGLSGGYNWSNTELAAGTGRTSWQTGIRLSYPVFNGLQREAAVQRANAQRTVAEAQAAEAERTAVAEFERLLAGLQLAEQQVLLLEESVEVAREDYRVQQQRYEHGAATILELVSSRIALTQAEYDLINARYDYQISVAELESLVGREL